METEDDGPVKQNIFWLLQEMWSAWAMFGDFLTSATRMEEVNHTNTEFSEELIT